MKLGFITSQKAYCTLCRWEVPSMSGEGTKTLAEHLYLVHFRVMVTEHHRRDITYLDGPSWDNELKL